MVALARIEDDGTLTHICGCNDGRRIVCSAHCQVQGCGRRDGWHTDACVTGERIHPRDRSWFRGDVEFAA